MGTNWREGVIFSKNEDVNLWQSWTLIPDHNSPSRAGTQPKPSGHKHGPIAPRGQGQEQGPDVLQGHGPARVGSTTPASSLRMDNDKPAGSQVNVLLRPHQAAPLQLDLLTASYSGMWFCFWSREKNSIKYSSPILRCFPSRVTNARCQVTKMLILEDNRAIFKLLN